MPLFSRLSPFSLSLPTPIGASLRLRRSPVLDRNATRFEVSPGERRLVSDDGGVGKWAPQEPGSRINEIGNAAETAARHQACGRKRSPRGLVGLKDGRQQAVSMQALDPLAVESIGLGSALDLAGERGRRDGGVEPGLHQGQVQDVAVGPRRFEGDGGDTGLSQPVDELAEARGVGGELAGVGPRGGDPVGAVSDIDARGPGVADGHGFEFGRGLGRLGRGFGTRFHGGLRGGEPRDGGVGIGAAVPAGSGGVVSDTGLSPDVRPKTLPGPVEPAGGIVPPPKRSRAWPSAGSQGMLPTSSRRRAARKASRSGTRRCT